MRIVTVTIDEQGNQLFIKGKGTDIFLSLGEVVTKRGSHVVPINPVLNLCFRAIRALVSDTSKVAAWTRTWNCLWCAEIVNGPVLWASGTTRSKAIEAEVSYLNQSFLEAL
jgi:hypothetical protein